MSETDYELFTRTINDTPEINLDACHPILAYKFGFVVVLRVAVTLVSLLSVCGAGLIIGTFLVFKELRTRARQILVQLSIADLLVAIAHILGVNFTLPKFTNTICQEYEITSHNISSDVFCQVQGGIAVFSTIGSYFWTIAVAYYLLVIIVFENQRLGKFLLFISYPLCWGFPGILVFILGFKGYLGFRPSLDASWCYVTENHYNQSHEYVNKGPEIISQVFVYLTYITLPIIYIWIHCHIRVKLKRASKTFSISDKLQSRTKMADLKLTFIPIIFLFLKVWGTILGILYIYLKEGNRVKFSATPYNAVLILVASICSSAQGFVNCLLFCIFTKVIRARLLYWLTRWLCCKKHTVKEYMMQPSTSHVGTSAANGDLEDTTQYDQDDAVWDREQLVEGVAINQSPITSKSKLNGSFGRKQGGGMSTKSQLLSDSLNGFKYQSLSLGKSVGPE